MALAPTHLPTAPKTGAARRLRPTLATRRHRFERIGHRDTLATPSEVALRSSGIQHHLR